MKDVDMFGEAEVTKNQLYVVIAKALTGIYQEKQRRKKEGDIRKDEI